MPYRRRYRRRRFRRKKRASSAWAMAKKAWGYAKWIKTLLNVEKKHSIVSGNASITNNGSIVLLSSFAQGLDISDRSGNSMKAHSLACRWTVKQSTAATQTSVRLVIFIDKQQIQDTDPAVTDVLQSAAVTSGLNLGFLGRFHILYDRVISFSDSGSEVLNLKYFKRFKNQHLRWNGANASDKQKNHVYFMFISDEPTNTPSIEYNCRFACIDN